MKRALAGVGVVLVLTLGGLGGCGDDGGDEAFCDAVEDVRQKGAELAELDLPSLGDDRLDEAKAALVDLAESIRTALQEAPDKVADVLDDGLPLVDDVVGAIQSATSVQELIEQGQALFDLLQTTPAPRPGARQELSQAAAECAPSS